MTIHELIKQWVDDADITGTSAKNYLAWIRPFQIYISNRGINIKDVTKPIIIAYKHDLVEYLSDKTVNCYITALRMFYSWMVLNEYTKKNITTGIKLVRIKQTYRKHPLTMDQVVTLLNSCEDDTIGRRNRLIIELMLCTAIRSIEVSRLLHTDHKGTKIMIQGKGRNTKDAFMDIPDDISNKLSTSAINNESPYIFHTVTGKQLTPKYISNLINKQLNKAGINSKHITTHSLRHTAAVKAYNNPDYDIMDVKKFMRHSSVKTTEIYLQSITATHDGSKGIIQGISDDIKQAIKQSETNNNDASK